MTLKYAGPGCDVCGFGTVENIDEFDPRFPCPECGNVAVSLQERIDVIGRKLCFQAGSQGFRIERSLPGKSGYRRWWIIGGVEGDAVLPGSASAKDVMDAVKLAEGHLGIVYSH